MTRYQEKGKFIQAWGELGTKDNYRLLLIVIEYPITLLGF